MRADQGNDRAQCNLGHMYWNGTGVLQDYAEAARLFRLAADQGIDRAQCNLGNMYLNGTGVWVCEATRRWVGCGRGTGRGTGLSGMAALCGDTVGGEQKLKLSTNTLIAATNPNSNLNPEPEPNPRAACPGPRATMVSLQQCWTRPGRAALEKYGLGLRRFLGYGDSTLALG